MEVQVLSSAQNKEVGGASLRRLLFCSTGEDLKAGGGTQNASHFVAEAGSRNFAEQNIRDQVLSSAPVVTWGYGAICGDTKCVESLMLHVLLFSHLFLQYAHVSHSRIQDVCNERECH